MIHDFKLVISILAILLTIWSYSIYIKDILQKKTIPHTFTFLIWSISSAITFGLQVVGGAGVGAWITASVTIIVFAIFLLSLKYGEKNITLLDKLFLLTSICALGLWLLAQQPLISLGLLILSGLVAMAPTIRKSWHNPWSETLYYWELNAFRHALGIFALESVNLLTLLYPATWAVTNLFFSVLLILRRRVNAKLCKPMHPTLFDQK